MAPLGSSKMGYTRELRLGGQPNGGPMLRVSTQKGSKGMACLQGQCAAQDKSSDCRGDDGIHSKSKSGGRGAQLHAGRRRQILDVRRVQYACAACDRFAAKVEPAEGAPKSYPVASLPKLMIDAVQPSGIVVVEGSRNGFADFELGDEAAAESDQEDDAPNEDDVGGPAPPTQVPAAAEEATVVLRCFPVHRGAVKGDACRSGKIERPWW